MAQLNKDILFLVCEELQEDSKSLFSCLMINRLWCEVAVPILWRDPWCYAINYYNKSSLYSIFTSYLSDDTKECLTKQGIQLPSISHKSLCFDYLSFCRSFSVPVLNTIIPMDSFNQSLLQDIYHHIIRKCPELRWLNIESFEGQIFYFLEDTTRLESIGELRCDTSIDSSHLKELAHVCKFIQRLIIINKCLKVNDGIVDLIKAQKNLKYFEWKDNFRNDDDFVEDPYMRNFLALETNADTLNSLIISLQYIERYTYEELTLHDILTKLHKLKTLIITGDVLIIFPDDQLKNMVYRELEIFNMDFISLGEASSIIENSGGHIKEIPLSYEYYDNCYDNLEEESLIFIPKIYKNCLLVEKLSLLFILSKQYFIEFENLLKVCKKIKSLTLRVTNSNEETREELLNILTRSAPIKLREIRFLNYFQFPLKSLERFLERWKGRHAISIYATKPTKPTYDDNSYTNLINRYKNNGVIKDFIFNV
jgi:hypothetical protein